MTAIAYVMAGLYTAGSFAILRQIVPSVIVGVPVGALVIARVRAETFRRICMSFDAWVVAFGLSALLRDLHVVDSGAYLLMVSVIAIDGWLLYRFFSRATAPRVTYAA